MKNQFECLFKGRNILIDLLLKYFVIYCICLDETLSSNIFKTQITTLIISM